MKKVINYIFLSLSVLLFFLMCKDKNHSEFYDNGVLKSTYKHIYGNAYSYKEYDSLGNIKILSDIENGKQNGKTTFFYENGKPKRIVFFTNGIQRDSMLLYYPNGNIKERSFTINGEKNGGDENL